MKRAPTRRRKRHLNLAIIRGEFVFQPFHLARALAEARAWGAPERLAEHERVAVSIGEDGLPEPRT